jgi:act minimal PKS ketosynthase (KS/KS alpha)
MDRAAQFAVVAPARRWPTAASTRPSSTRRTGSASPSAARRRTMGLERGVPVVSDGGRLAGRPRSTRAAPVRLPVPSSFAAEVAWAVGAEGPATRCPPAAPPGLDAVGHAAELIREGTADVMIAGRDRRADLADHRRLLRRDQGHHAAQRRPRARLPAVRRDPQRVRARRGRGHVRPGGAGARPPRRAHIYAEIAGFATRSNAYHMTGLRPDGREMAEAIRVALARPGWTRPTSTTSTRTARAPSRTTGTRPPRSSAASATTRTGPRSARSSR